MGYQLSGQWDVARDPVAAEAEGAHHVVRRRSRGGRREGGAILAEGAYPHWEVLWTVTGA